MKVIIFIGFLIICACDYASADNLYVGAWSKHINPQNVTNESHDLIAYEHNGYIAGRMINSYGDETYLAGKEFVSEKTNEFLGKYDLSAGLYLGATYGYLSCTPGQENATGKDVCPAAIPYISYTKYRIQPTVLIMGNAIAFSFKINL